MSAVLARAKAILFFLYDFVIGDDWRVALGVVIALALTWAISRSTSTTWWILPIAVVVLLSLSLRRAVRHD